MEFRAQIVVQSDSLAPLSVAMKRFSPKVLMNVLAAEIALVVDELSTEHILTRHIQGVLKFEPDALSRLSQGAPIPASLVNATWHASKLLPQLESKFKSSLTKAPGATTNLWRKHNVTTSLDQTGQRRPLCGLRECTQTRTGVSCLSGAASQEEDRRHSRRKRFYCSFNICSLALRFVDPVEPCQSLPPLRDRTSLRIWLTRLFLVVYVLSTKRWVPETTW